MKIPGDVNQRDLSVTTDSQKLKDAIIVLPWVKLQGDPEALRMMCEEWQDRTAAESRYVSALNKAVLQEATDFKLIGSIAMFIQKLSIDNLPIALYKRQDEFLTNCFSGAFGSAVLSLTRMVIGSVPDITYTPTKKKKKGTKMNC